jgi:hypothetical protein
MNCIICQDSLSEYLQDNISCSCKYQYHIGCWIDYVHSREKVICPLCRKDLSVKQTSKTRPTLHTPLRQSTQLPYTPQLHTIPEELGQQITYQEFVDTINNYNRTQNTVVEVQSSIQPVSPKPESKYEKIVKIICVLGVLVAIIVLIIIFV